MDNRPIALFDSGVGGLTVARELVRRLPQESLLYLADTGRLPYGTRPPAQVAAFTLQIIRFLEEKGAKMAVIACNTATAAGLEMARRSLTLPVLGVIDPGAAMAAQATRNGRIGISATPATVSSGAYERAIKRINPDLEVHGEPCPEFVYLVEGGVKDVELAKRTAQKCLSPLLEKGIDTLVLGCTHFPFLNEIIAGVVGETVRLIDPAVGTVSEIERILQEKDLVSESTVPQRTFFTSGDPAVFRQIGSLLFGHNIEKVEVVHWES
ncbi:MAG: glutamate racemase [Firmicutes bacterium]|nr:glutamate racemase [Bacillota bacterium]